VTLARRRENYDGNGLRVLGNDDFLDRDMILPDTEDEYYGTTHLERNGFNEPAKKMDFSKDKKSLNHFLRDRQGSLLHFLRDRKAVRNQLSHFLRDRKTLLTKNHFLRDRRSINMDMLRRGMNTQRAKKELNHLLRDRKSQQYYPIH
jgi:hypothetical protein